MSTSRTVLSGKARQNAAADPGKGRARPGLETASAECEFRFARDRDESGTNPTRYLIALRQHRSSLARRWVQRSESEL